MTNLVKWTSSANQERCNCQADERSTPSSIKRDRKGRNNQARLGDNQAHVLTYAMFDVIHFSEILQNAVNFHLDSEVLSDAIQRLHSFNVTNEYVLINYFREVAYLTFW